MTSRETREKKLQRVISRLDEIEKLRLELRKILPKNSEEEVMRSDEASTDRSCSDSESTESVRSIVRSVDASQQTTGKKPLKSEPKFDLLTLSWSPERMESSESLKFEDLGSGSAYSSKYQTKSPRKSVSVSVQTGEKPPVDFEPYDLLDYLRLPAKPKVKLVGSAARQGTPSPIFSSRPSGAGIFSWLFGSFIEGPDAQESTKNGRRGMASSDLPIFNAPRTFWTGNGWRGGAAAAAPRTPAGSARLDEQQVPEKKQATEGNRMGSFLEAKSQETGDVVRRDGPIRVPLRETRRSRITEEWEPAITVRSGLAGTSMGYREAENRGTLRRRTFEWFHKNKGRLKSLSKEVEDQEEEEENWEPEEPEDLNERRSGQTKKSKCWGCCGSGSKVAEVVVPYHHTGDRTPRLVESTESVGRDNKTETLRVVSSAGRVRIRKSSQYRYFLSQR